MTVRTTRRALLGLLALGASAGLAGCLGDDDGDDDLDVHATGLLFDPDDLEDWALVDEGVLDEDAPGLALVEPDGNAYQDFEHEVYGDDDTLEVRVFSYEDADDARDDFDALWAEFEAEQAAEVHDVATEGFSFEGGSSGGAMRAGTDLALVMYRRRGTPLDREIGLPYLEQLADAWSA